MIGRIANERALPSAGIAGDASVPETHLGLPISTWKRMDAVRQLREDYELEVLRHPDGRLVVLLGERHLHTQSVHRPAEALVEAFPRRAIEGTKVYRNECWPVTRFLDRAYETVMDRGSEAAGVRGSLTTYAKKLASEWSQPEGARPLEEGHVPSKSEQVALLVSDVAAVPLAVAYSVTDKLDWLSLPRFAQPIREKLTAGMREKTRAFEASIAQPVEDEDEERGQPLPLDLLEGRNKTMWKNLSEQSRGGPTLAIVGREHLRGKGQGLGDLLEQEGFRPAQWPRLPESA